MAELNRPVRTTDLRQKKERGEKIAILTAYDASMARLLERAGIDVLLVGDSLGTVIMGEGTTIPVTLEAMVHHTRAVVKGVRQALVIADMPFLSYHASVAEAVHSARRLMQEGGASAVKIEGGRAVADTARRLVEFGVPVMGHLGLTPQSFHQLGGHRRQATTAEAAENLYQEALLLEEAGVFSIVLELIPAALARRVTEALCIPTIGIGSGPHCDGQVLVLYDMLGLFDEFVPPFVKQYAQLSGEIVKAAQAYADDVRAGRFPEPE
jgi:3-methyl-2-oxobutanoate hydroxymethyltransferase